MVDETFPTEFAVRIGERCKLLLKKKHANSHKREQYVSRYYAMQDFQNMALNVSFKEAMKIAWFDYEISEEQKKMLKAIYKSTRPWILGRNTQILLGKLNKTLCTGKDAKEITAAIAEHLDVKSEKGSGNNPGNAMFSIVPHPDFKPPW